MADQQQRHQVAVIGLNSDHIWATVKGLRDLPGVELVGVADENSSLRDKARQTWQIDSVYEDAAQMLDATDPSVVLIFTESLRKLEFVRLAARKGRAIYLDKPMATTPLDAYEIAKICQENHSPMMVGYHGILAPGFVSTKAAVQSGGIGDVYLARGTIGHAGPIEAGPSPEFSEWLVDPVRNGGGAFIDMACYLIAEMIAILGPIEEISGAMSRVGDHPYLRQDMEDVGACVLHFQSGALATIDSNWNQADRPAPTRTSYHGTRGSIYCMADSTELITDNAAVLAANDWEDLGAAGQIGAAGPHLTRYRAINGVNATSGPVQDGTEQQHFLRCITDGVDFAPGLNVDIALQVQDALSAFYTAAHSGTTIKLG